MWINGFANFWLLCSARTCWGSCIAPPDHLAVIRGRGWKEKKREGREGNGERSKERRKEKREQERKGEGRDRALDIIICQSVVKRLQFIDLSIVTELLLG